MAYTQSLSNLSNKQTQALNWCTGAINITVATSSINNLPRTINLSDTIGHGKNCPKAQHRTDQTCYWLQNNLNQNTDEFRQKVIHPLFVRACHQAGFIIHGRYDARYKAIVFQCRMGLFHDAEYGREYRASRPREVLNPDKPPIERGRRSQRPVKADDQHTCRVKFCLYWCEKRSRWFLPHMQRGNLHHCGHMHVNHNQLRIQSRFVQPRELKVAKDALSVRIPSTFAANRSEENGTVTNEGGSVTTSLGITFPTAIVAITEDAERHPERGRTSDRIHAYSCWRNEGHATPVPKKELGTSLSKHTLDEASISDDQDTKPAAVKKRCMDDSTSSLPAELWANVLGYLYFDEVLTCTAISKSFYSDVPPHLRHLCIRFGKGMSISTNIIKRFDRVKDVFIYLIQESLHAGYTSYKYRFDYDAATHTARFLSNIPNLQWAFLGGVANWHRHMVRHGLVYDVNEGFSYDNEYCPNLLHSYGAMIHSMCDAYRRGDISNNVDIEGLLPIQGPPFVHGKCAWKHKAPRISPPHWRTDVACQTCDMICMSYPPAKVLMLTDMEVPCVEMENRMAISRQRDEKHFKKNLTDALVTVVESSLYDTIMLPPKYVTKGLALSYNDYQYNMMEKLIELGANIKDPRIFQAIMRDVSKNDSPYQRDFDTIRTGQTEENRHQPKAEPPCTTLHDSKRIIKQTTYNKLKNIGLELNPENFSIIDASDRRTGVIGDDMRRMRDQLNSADSVRDVDEAVTWLRGMVRYYSDSTDLVINTLQRELSTEFTQRRRGEMKELFQELCAE